MSPERVSVGDEGESHSVKMDRSPQKRRGNQKRRRAWHEEYGGSGYQKQSGEYRKACKVEDSHRDKAITEIQKQNEGILCAFGKGVGRR